MSVLVIAALICSLLGLAWTMDRYSYDVWGAFWIAPVLLLLTLPVAAHLTRTDSDPTIGRFVMAAVVVKLVLGTSLRYWMAFTLYDGTDPQRYHLAGRQLAPLFRAGNFDDLGRISGTRFIEILIGNVYALTGACRLGGFLVFSWLAFLGLVFMYKAVRLAFPEADLRRYRLLVFLFPTLVFWPSSIGKEAWMLLCIGAAVFGIASLMVSRWSGLLWAGLGFWGAAVVRPHVALLLVVGAVAAAPVRLWSRPAVDGPRRRGGGVILLLFVAGASVLLVSRAADFFGLESLDSEAAQGVFTDVEGHTAQGGSAFHAPSASSPIGYLEAVATVLFRPVIFEAHNAQSLVSALEGMVLMALIAVSLARLRRLPVNLARMPLVTMAFVFCAGFIFAFSSIENFGILARQRAQVLPLLFILFVAEPPRRRVAKRSSGRRGRAIRQPVGA
jgi:hypothetical protein